MKKLMMGVLFWAVAGLAMAASNPTDWKVSYDSVMSHYNAGRTDQAYAELSRLGLSGAEKDLAWAAIKGGTTWGNSTEFDNWMNTPTPKPEPSRPDWFPVLEKQFRESQAAQDAVIDTKAGKDDLAAAVDHQKATDSKQDKALTDAVAKQGDRDADQDKAIKGKADQAALDSVAAGKADSATVIQVVEDQKKVDAAQDKALTDTVAKQAGRDAAQDKVIAGKADKTTVDKVVSDQAARDTAQDKVIGGKADKSEVAAVVADQKKVDAAQDKVIAGKVESGTFEKSQAAQDVQITANRDGLAQEVIDRKAGDDKTLASANSYSAQIVNQEVKSRDAADKKVSSDAKADTANQVAFEANARKDGDRATLKSANTYTDGAVGTEREQRIAGDAATLRGANSYTDNRFGQLSKMVDENRDEARAGTAAALAASQIPQVSQGRDFSLGAGVGTYRGENAVAVGVSARFNERTVTKFAITADSQSGVGAGAGVSYEW